MSAACLILLVLGSDVYTDFFTRGNAAYRDGDMAAAASAYERLVESGVENPEVFYNLASAYYHGEDVGRAVLNYERAIGLDPGFKAASRALGIVADEAGIAERPARFNLDGQRATIAGAPGWYVNAAALAIWWLLWGILAARYRRGRGRWKKAAAAAWGMLAVVAMFLLLPEPDVRSAVVVAPETPARYGPTLRDEVRMTLAPGDRAIVNETDGEWVRVALADGRQGWVEERALAYVGPPFSTESNERAPQIE